VNEDTDRLIGLAMLVALAICLRVQVMANDDPSIWRKVRCQRCGALPIDTKGKPTAACPVCFHTELGQHAPDYTTPTAADKRWLASLKIAV
jgi:DNA-directed RNA polymerase subunit RPC12/RpoP